MRSNLLIILKAFICFAIGLYICTFCTIYFYNGDTQIDENVDTIVVLGAAVVQNEDLNPCLTARVDKAIELSKSGKIKKIIFSGGVDEGTLKNEALEMKKYFISKAKSDQIPEIITEENSTTTYENLKFSSNFVAPENNILIISEAYHLLRVKLIASDLKLRNSVVRTNYSPCDGEMIHKIYYVNREVFATIKYYLYR